MILKLEIESKTIRKGNLRWHFTCDLWWWQGGATRLLKEGQRIKLCLVSPLSLEETLAMIPTGTTVKVPVFTLWGNLEWIVTDNNGLPNYLPCFWKLEFGVSYLRFETTTYNSKIVQLKHYLFTIGHCSLKPCSLVYFSKTFPFQCSSGWSISQFHYCIVLYLRALFIKRSYSF